MSIKPLAVRSVTLAVLLAVLFGLHAEASSLVPPPGSAGVTCYTLTTNVGSGSGSVLASPTTWGACPEGQYASGYQPVVSGQPAPGFIWTNWSGTDNDSTNPTLVTMNADRKVTANFESNCYTLTTNVGAGSGSVVTSPLSAGGCPNGQYPFAYTAAVSAEPAPGFVWTNWSGTDNDVSNPTLVTMNADRKVSANFASNCYTLTTNVGAGSGSVLASPKSAGGCASDQYPYGYAVAISAQPATGSIWTSWSGTDNDNTNPTTITMNGDRKVTANFAGNCFALTTSIGAGSGSVLTSPLSAGGCPDGQYPSGYQAAVVALPSVGFVWSSWSGADNNTSNPTTVTMDKDRKVTANFKSNCFSLKTVIGGGSGSITTVPTSDGGCPPGQYPDGFMVVILAQPTGNFLNWSGADGGGNPTTVTIKGHTTITAFFAVPDPTATPKPTVEPTATAKPTPTNEPKPTDESKPTSPPEPTKTPVPTFTPAPTLTAGPTSTKAPEATATPTKPQPDATPTATKPKPIATATPTTAKSEPTSTPAKPSPSATMTPTPTAKFPAGDANCDGIVNTIDAIFMLQAGAGLLASVPCPTAADVDLNGVVDAIDASLTLQYRAGLLASLPT